MLRYIACCQEIEAAKDEIAKNTPQWIRAPEQINVSKGHVINEKVDIWALGLLLLEFVSRSSSNDFVRGADTVVGIKEHIGRLTSMHEEVRPPILANIISCLLKLSRGHVS